MTIVGRPHSAHVRGERRGARAGVRECATETWSVDVQLATSTRKLFITFTDSTTISERCRDMISGRVTALAPAARVTALCTSKLRRVT
jgi:hypothetical protein